MKPRPELLSDSSKEDALVSDGTILLALFAFFAVPPANFTIDRFVNFIPGK
jgi:hypothetical protein